MFGWKASLAIAASAAALIALFITLLIRRFYNFSKQGTKVVSESTTHHTSHTPLFRWVDHPALIADAAQNGWSRFAFTTRENQVELGWEVGEGSADFMQKIRMNPGKAVLTAALPLPGPAMGNPYSFPQEAYFEITVSSSPGDGIKEGEKTKLIAEKSSDGKGNLEGLEEVKVGGRGGVIISVGLTSLSLVSLKIPGSYPGSIGFNSDGSTHLDGIKLDLGAEGEEWGKEEKVIGCGFDPRKKKVFFTVDSKLVHVVHCTSDEFGSPLYPVIVANADITLVVNLGQRRFSYEAANELRKPSPCFIGPLVRSPAALGYDDSGELFSMGRLDSGWHHHGNAESRTNSGICGLLTGAYNNEESNAWNHGSKVREEDDDSEADLFEIVLDVKGDSQLV